MYWWVMLIHHICLFCFTVGSKKRESPITKAEEYIQKLDDPPGFTVETFKEKGNFY